MAVAGGRFAPGHLGELTRLVPFGVVDGVLERCGVVQARVRLVPARVVVYLLLAGVLFADVGYRQVWGRLTAGLGGLAGKVPTASALCQARVRLGTGPLRALFELLAGPAPTTAPEVEYRGLLVAAIDGTLLNVPDSAANLAVYYKTNTRRGVVGYPMLRLVAVVACGTRSVIAAVFGPGPGSETGYATALAGSLRAGMLLLADRAFCGTQILAVLAGGGNGRGAALLVRCKSNRRLPPIARLADGTFLARSGPLTVRVIDAEITITTVRAVRTERYRLLTTLTDPHTYPAAELIGLYHERWEIETCYAELKSTLLHGRVLRSRTPEGIEQEMWALLIVHQLLRTAMAGATDTIDGLDPDRASFTTALLTARDQIILAAGITGDGPLDAITRQILDHLLPARRCRTKARIVKRALSKYNARGPAPDRTTYPATITTTQLTSPNPPN